MNIKLINTLKKNKWLICIVIIFLFSSIVYRFYKVNSYQDINKEIVNIVLPTSEITEELKIIVEDFNLENKEIEINLEIYESDYLNVAITKIVNSRDIDIFEYFDRFLIDKDEIQNLDNLNLDYSKIDSQSIVRFNNDAIGVRYGEVDQNSRIMVVRNYDKAIDSLTNIKEKDIEAHKKAVKDVYELLVSDEIRNKILDNNIKVFRENNYDNNTLENIQLNEEDIELNKYKENE